MALTVRPDDEVYQFDTVWLGPDEYTLPIQARYVAWGTWLVCFLVAVVVLVPLGGKGPGGVLGSIVWSIAVSVVLSRAVMLVVDHERPLRSLPALFSAEARAALAARRRSDRALLLTADKVTVRSTPEKVLAMRDRDHERADRRAAKRRPKAQQVPDLATDLEPYTGPAWTPDLPPEEWQGPALAWTVPSDRPAGQAPARVPVTATAAAATAATAGAHPTGPAPNAARHERDDGPPREERQEREEGQKQDASPRRSGPFRDYSSEPVTVSPTRGRHAAHDEVEDHHEHPHDRQAALEARILLPVRKDR